MNEEIDYRYQTAKTLAGPLYDDLVGSKEAALDALSAPEENLRLAAMLICDHIWKVGSDQRLFQACVQVVSSNVNDSMRICAMSVLGRAFQSSRSSDESRFLATIVHDDTIGSELRSVAYYALRQVQFGIAGSDFDDFLKATFFTVKSILRSYPMDISEERAKSALTSGSEAIQKLWDSAEEIDWSFVNQFIGDGLGKSAGI